MWQGWSNPKRLSICHSTFRACIYDNDVNLVFQPVLIPQNSRIFTDPFAYSYACERRSCTRRDYNEQECRNGRLPVACSRRAAADTERCASAGSAGNLVTITIGMAKRASGADDCFEFACLWAIHYDESAFDHALTASCMFFYGPATSILAPLKSCPAKCDYRCPFGME
jgi:hypothetical protein